MELVKHMESTIADGGMMPVYVSEPKDPGKYPVVIVFIEAFGLNGHIKNVADTFAGAGYVAVAPDMYYRYGPDKAFGYTDMDPAIKALTGMYDAQTHADARTALNFAKALPKANPDAIATTGYCMGGTISWMTACLNRDVKAAAVYYSGGIITRKNSIKRPASPHEYAELLTAPVLGLFGELDQNPAPADVKELDDLLTKLGKPHKFTIYPGANHGFNCDERASYHKPSADDAWKQVFEWFQTHLK